MDVAVLGRWSIALRAAAGAKARDAAGNMMIVVMDARSSDLMDGEVVMIEVGRCLPAFYDTIDSTKECRRTTLTVRCDMR